MNDIHSNNHDDQPPVPPQPPLGGPHPQPPPPPGAAQEDVWGVRPPVLGPQPTGYGTPQGAAQGATPHGATPQGYGQGTGAGSSQLDRGLSALQRSPLRRDTSGGIVGGVASGIAKRMDVSPAVVRLAAVVLALFFGSGIAAYLIAWALMPDESGRTHVEQGVKGGSTQSLIVVVLGGLAALGMLSTILDGLGWLVPIAVTAGIVYYVVNAGKKKGDGTAR